MREISNLFPETIRARISPEDRAALERVAANRKTKLSVIVREAVAEYIKRKHSRR